MLSSLKISTFIALFAFTLAGPVKQGDNCSNKKCQKGYQCGEVLSKENGLSLTSICVSKDQAEYNAEDECPKCSRGNECQEVLLRELDEYWIRSMCVTTSKASWDMSAES
jgi:hypothetical protein